MDDARNHRWSDVARRRCGGSIRPIQLGEHPEIGPAATTATAAVVSTATEKGAIQSQGLSENDEGPSEAAKGNRPSAQETGHRNARAVEVGSGAGLLRRPLEERK